MDTSKTRRVRWIGGKHDEDRGIDSRTFGIAFPRSIGRAVAGMEFHIEVREDEIALIPVGAKIKEQPAPSLDPAAVVLAQKFRSIADAETGGTVVDESRNKIALT